MKLVSLKLDRKDAEGQSAEVAAESPAYPYGTCLHLDTGALAKLGIDTEDDAEVGAEVRVEARGIVTGYSVQKRQGGEDYRCVDIQLTDMAVEPEGESETAADKIYGS